MTTRFFVVDDDRHYARLLSYRLEKGKDHDVRVLHSGEEALEALAHSGAPDLVLLDIMMPVLDGWFVLAELAGRAKKPKVIVCSAKSADVDKARARDLGADAYVVKPWDPEALVQTMRDVLAAKHAGTADNLRV